MFQKLAIAGTTAALLLTTALPAGAHWWGGWDDDLNLDIDNDAHVDNDVTTKANTGFNTVNGIDWEYDGGGLIFTGNAGALSDVLNTVNTNVVDLCGCLDDFDDVDIDIDNDAHVDNDVTTKANTGFNTVNGFGLIDTGDAGAQSWVENVVNTNVLGSL